MIGSGQPTNSSSNQSIYANTSNVANQNVNNSQQINSEYSKYFLLINLNFYIDNK